MPLALPILLTLALQPGAVKPAPAPATCVLHLQGTLNHLTTSGGVQTRTFETFEYRIPGALTETTTPEGEVTFDFTADPKAAEKGSAKLSLRTSTFGKGAMEEIQFTGKKLQAVGTFRFQARGRGQAIHPTGGLYVEGLAKVSQATPAGTEQREETRFMISTPFPGPGAGVAEASRPALQFTGSSLWVLKNIASGATLSGSITYPGGAPAGGTSSSGKVEFRFAFSK